MTDLISTYSDEQLLAMLRDLESDFVERKESAADLTKIRQTVCAFANDLPNHEKAGVIFIGATDDGAPSGQDITDELSLKCSNMRTDGKITPFPVMTVQKRTLDGYEYLVLTVEPSRFPPLRVDGGAWVRTGSSRRRASREEEMRLSEKRRGRDLPFDVRENETATKDDLLLDYFLRNYLPSAIDAETLAANNRTENEKLMALHMMGTEGGHPTNLALLMFGRDPSYFIPGAHIQFLRIDGTDMDGAIKDMKDLQGPLFETLRILDDLSKINISTAIDFTSGSLESRSPDYPLVALQQLVRNAILHRDYESSNAPVQIHWYSDRVEIYSPGGPFGRVTRENFGAPGITDYRNRNLAQAMKTLGYVQSFGMGIAAAKKECEKNGNPAPKFLVEPTTIMARLRPSGSQT